MQLAKIPKLEDLRIIQEFFVEEGYEHNVEVVFRIKSKELLNRVNEEFYYNNNRDGNPPDVDEVKVSIGGVDFKYVLEENAAEE